MACLALGIGANTAIFTVINAVLVRPLPYPDPERLVMVWSSSESRHRERNTVSPGDFQDWRAENQVFERMAGLYDTRMNLSGDAEPVEVPVEYATAELFPLLGLTPVVGRTYTAAEDAPGGPPVALVSYGLWQRRFGGARSVVGRTISLDGKPYTVIGVLPAGAGVAGRPVTPDLWIPFAIDPALDYRVSAGRFMLALGRLKPGVTRDQAQAASRHDRPPAGGRPSRLQPRLVGEPAPTGRRGDRPGATPAPCAGRRRRRGAAHRVRERG